MAHGVTPDALREHAGAATPDARGGVHRLPDLLRHGRRRRRLRGGAPKHRGGVAARSSTSRGARTSASMRPAAERAVGSGADVDADERAQDRRLADADAMLHVGRHRPRRSQRDLAHAVRIDALDHALVAADGLARRRAPAARGARRGRCPGRRSTPLAHRRRESSARWTASSSSTRRSSVARASRTCDPLGSSSTSAARAPPGTDALGRAAPELRHPGRARHAGHDRARARDRRAAARRSSASSTTSRRSSARMDAPGRDRAEVYASHGHVRERGRDAPREAFLGEADAWSSSDDGRAASAEAIAGYPPGIPVLLPGSGSPTRSCATCAR